MYIIAGNNADRVLASLTVADAFKARGHFTNIIESGLKAFPDAVRNTFSFHDSFGLPASFLTLTILKQGFMYYMDVDAEEARQKAIAAAAAAAAQKK